MIWTALLSGVVGLGKEWMSDRAKKKQDKRDITAAQTKSQIKLIESAADQAGAQDILASQQQDKTIMDDAIFWLIYVQIVGTMIPITRPYVEESWQSLDTMPTELKILFGGMAAAVWGYRRLLLPLMQAMITRYFK